MLYRKSDKSTSYHFGSLHELANWIDETPRTWRYNTSNDHEPNDDWDLSAGYDASVKMAQYGWIEGAQKSQATLKPMRPTTPVTKNALRVSGSRVKVSKYVTGNPRCMINRKTVQQTATVLTLIVPVNALGNVSAQYMANFGLGIAHYIAQLQKAGTRVEVWGALNSQVDEEMLTHTFVIKRASQPLDLAVLSFAVGHPAMFRRLGFALRERSTVRENSNYGRTQPLSMGHVISPPRGAVILNGMARANEIARTPAEASQYIANEIANAQKGARNLELLASHAPR